MSDFILICLIIAAFFLIIIIYYNTFLLRRNDVKKAFSSLDTELKKRFDLIPNLTAAVKKYMNHESSILIQIAKIRSQFMHPDVSREIKMQCDSQLSHLCRQLIAQVESNPNLKANENMMHLQRTLNETEEQISAMRRTYNAAVTEYNNCIQLFPNCLFAMAMGFKTEPLFEATVLERENVDVGRLFE